MIGRLTREAGAEPVQRRRHEKQPLARETLVHLHYEPLGLLRQGAAGPCAHPKARVRENVTVGALDLQRLVHLRLPALIGQVARAPQQVVHVDRVQRREALENPGSGPALALLYLGQVRVGDAREAVDSSLRLILAPQLPEQMSQFTTISRKCHPWSSMHAGDANSLLTL